MKNIFITILSIYSYSAFAQVAIAKKELSSPDVSLEFANGNRGIILPWVNQTSEVINAVPGTMIYDVSDQKVKVKLNTSWRDLSTKSGTVDTSLQSALPETGNTKVIFGNNKSDTAPGVLVLSDSNKAMILPKMESPHLNIKNPEPGTMAYDTLTHQLAVFNGEEWTFWKP